MSATRIHSLDIRRIFLDYFAARGHERVASSSLVPQNDPTLLFANAGMNQFKDVFTGQAKRAINRATTSQKCVRAGGKHNDLDNVGRTARHHTFFEMLGNFSFGDYFKPEAIGFAHELLVGQFGIDAKRLVYTVHDSDDEARALWKKIAGVDDSRVISLGDKDNFWAMGETGPCGPCSEIHFHQGDDVPCAEAAAGGKCLGPACDCDRWIEIWNLVFMQYEQLPDRTRRPLPRPSVDTGMGLERLCAVLGGFRSNYETDLLRPLITIVEGLSGKTFAPSDYADGRDSVSMRAIADHARTTAFLVADGVFPDKTGREYVLRRIMRRAVYHGWLLGIKKSFLAPVVDHVITQMGDVYPDLRERRSVILEVSEQEERRFRETLDRGLRILQEESEQLVGKTVPGDLAFKLYDTYGFPMDLTRVIAENRGLGIDEAGFEANMQEQRRRADFSGSGEVAVEGVFKTIAERVGPTKFVGYETLGTHSAVVALVYEGKDVDVVVGPTRGPVAMICRETPFYGEQGGQVGDAGTATTPVGTMTVTDTKRPVPTLYVHLGEITQGELRVGGVVALSVDEQRRDAIRRNHSATHLLHGVLRTVLGDHVAQKGSLVTPDRLRFDFSHFAPLTDEERHRVEVLVNESVLKNVRALIEELPIAEAKKAGAIAFFGEKYGDTVRVMTMGESKEFCGGTHVSRTGDIGFFKITEEAGVAQGVRRLEAVTGAGAQAFVDRLERELRDAGARLRGGTFEVAAKVERLQGDLRERDKEIERLRGKLAAGGGQDLGAQAIKVGDMSLLVASVAVGDPKTLRETVDKLRDRLNPGVIVLAGIEGEKVQVVAAVTKDAVARFNAGKIVSDLSQSLGGKGGGRADMAQGGGPKPDALDAVVSGWRDKLRAMMSSGPGSG